LSDTGKVLHDGEHVAERSGDALRLPCVDGHLRDLALNTLGVDDDVVGVVRAPLDGVADLGA
jgi:hypothetical protein